MRHVPEYRLRVGDRLGLVFRLTTIPSTAPYQLTVGDEVTIESLTSDDVQRSVIIQPDGTITLRLLGQVKVAGRTVEEVRNDLDERYRKFLRDPSITVTPIKLNTKLQELRATVDARQGLGGQQREAARHPRRHNPTARPGPVPTQGLTLGELSARSTCAIRNSSKVSKSRPFSWNGPRGMSSWWARCACQAVTS